MLPYHSPPNQINIRAMHSFVPNNLTKTRQWQQHKEQNQTQIFHLAIKWTQHFAIDHYLSVIKQKLALYLGS